MRGLFFILGVVVLLTVAAMHFGYLRFGDGAPAATPDQGMTVEQEAERIAAEEPPAKGAD